MARFEPNLTRIAMQDKILAKFGPEKIQERKQQLCNVCPNACWTGIPCKLLPITLEGQDCPYFSPSEISTLGGGTDG
jgi:hypothetical protein